jgi:chemotaxis protein CheD
MTRLANTVAQVRMGEIAVAAQEGVLRTLLGSCIGLVLYDRRRRTGGLAHIVLPDSQGRSDQLGKYVDTAVPELIRQMEAAADEKLQLTARFAGGANMFATSADETIGLQNSQRIRETLKNRGIAIEGDDCGGTKGRRLSFDVATGTVKVEVVGQDTIEL